jgi:hypothetical protein
LLSRGLQYEWIEFEGKHLAVLLEFTVKSPATVRFLGCHEIKTEDLQQSEFSGADVQTSVPAQAPVQE